MSDESTKSGGRPPRGPARKGPRGNNRGGGRGQGPNGQRHGDSRSERPGGRTGGRPAKGSMAKGRSAKPQAPRGGGRATAPVADGPDWLYGIHAVRAALLNPKRRILRIIATEKAFETIAEPARKRGLQVEKADARELDQMFPVGAVHQGLALRVAPLPEPVLADIIEQTKAAKAAGETARPVVILDQVTDPQNVGAVLRSAAVFGARAVIVTRRNSPPVTGALAKAASGAVEQMQLVQVPNVAQAIAVLQSESWFAVGLEGTGDKSLSQIDLTGKIAIVMGAEGTGLRRLTAERCDMLARIPGEPGFASLNVSNATAVTLYEISRQRGA
ncbi:23S rRNA (guanosine(2251)-2'-O)-methyltransferase RlmB [Pyruvatibacter mobilis]|uniref:23S rRNA (guanosine(2251)-2'-O)-methyltransferase RlmB n=1 Tax=Pyruvatibacter mobilis TaxID=1712261 RepID=UPI003BB088BE